MKCVMEWVLKRRMKMTKSALEIAENCGAYITDTDYGWLKGGQILFDSEAQLIATINAVNAQTGEPDAEYVERLEKALEEIGSANWHFSMSRKIANEALASKPKG